ncbi:hypothetical protein [Caballeronia pedi]|uniref:hypothetical protein n=1 Tax=Caballeronia pedi TaxID=1777141 RepID=UPI0011788DD4|nr:hypothetical protein [Caballeronia pedi]
MLTDEGADDAEVIVRPSARGGWQVEVPTSEGMHVTAVDSEREALALAHSLRPHAEVRILPAAESAETLRNELRPDHGRIRSE